jgi:hypothetical protein
MIDEKPVVRSKPQKLDSGFTNPSKVLLSKARPKMGCLEEASDLVSKLLYRINSPNLI